MSFPGMSIPQHRTPSRSAWQCESMRLCGSLVVVCAFAALTYAATDTDVFRYSWISIGPNLDSTGAYRDTFTEGETWLLPVDYYLHSTDVFASTHLELTVYGPWVDCPDGVYVQKRGHHNYPGMRMRVPCVPGVKTSHVFRITIPAPFQSRTGRVGNSLLPICRFVDGRGEAWPWHVRGEGPWFTRNTGYFDLLTDRPGNLFTYDEAVVLFAILRPSGVDGDTHALTYRVYDTRDALVCSGTVAFTATAATQRIPLPLTLAARGTFLVEAAVPGWETRYTTFARIPDVPAITGGRTQFGVGWPGGLRDTPRQRAQLEIARRLGLMTRRCWLRWYEVQPAPDEWRRLDEYRRILEYSRTIGIATWLLLYDPPAWAQRGPMPRTVAFEPFPFDAAALHGVVSHLGGHLQGLLLGWEWLNEIVPGTASTDPVGDYARFVHIANQAAKAADPQVLSLLAGGLWPRSYRSALFAQGVAQDIDVLPVHYCNGSMIEEAREDLVAAGRPDVKIWDNESACGITTWTMPWRTAMQITAQGNWIMENWSDELIHGCERIVYFGGHGDPAGDWSYLWDDLTPRPVAATLAVFASKLHDARPLGTFRIGRTGYAHAFEKPGAKTLVIISASDPAGDILNLPVGTDVITLTDQQGNELTLPAPQGSVRLALSPLRVFVEGANLDVVKALVACRIVSHLAPEKRTPLVHVPVINALAGKPAPVAVRCRNLFDQPLAGMITASVSTNWPVPTPPPLSFVLPAGIETTLVVSITIPQDVDATSVPIALRVDYARTNLPAVTLSALVTVSDPRRVGNLLYNSGFEIASTRSNQVTGGWVADARFVARQRHTSRDRGHGYYVLAFTNTGGPYVEAIQPAALRGGPSYLYTAWIKTSNMVAGGNIRLYHRDGIARTLHMPYVFRTPLFQNEWDLFVCRFQTTPDIVNGTFALVGAGEGYAWFDNVRLTLYEGTDYTAECHRLPAPLVIDGQLDDWDQRCPIPLIGKSQLSVYDDSYRWSPANLSGVAWLRWDEKGLYFAADVLDDVHYAVSFDNDCVREDSIMLALHPHNRQPGFDDSAFVYYISGARPGGSGAHTLYRPAQYAGGLRAGSLARDSSVYDIAVRHRHGRTTYELFMPYTQLGGIRGAHGLKIGLALQLNDNDGKGLAASMHWGAGITPAWSPRNFGILTCVDN